jgi:hypothetical protein
MVTIILLDVTGFTQFIINRNKYIKMLGDPWHATETMVYINTIVFVLEDVTYCTTKRIISRQTFLEAYDSALMAISFVFIYSLS